MTNRIRHLIDDLILWPLYDIWRSFVDFIDVAFEAFAWKYLAIRGFLNREVSAAWGAIPVGIVAFIGFSVTGPYPLIAQIAPWVLWGALLITQNAAFTMVSRARTSGSLLYHAIAAVFSNGIWFASQFILVDKFLLLLKSGTIPEMIGTAVFYCLFTVFGSVGMHVLALKHEKGKAKARS